MKIITNTDEFSMVNRQAFCKLLRYEQFITTFIEQPVILNIVIDNEVLDVTFWCSYYENNSNIGHSCVKLYSVHNEDNKQIGLVVSKCFWDRPTDCQRELHNNEFFEPEFFVDYKFFWLEEACLLIEATTALQNFIFNNKISFNKRSNHKEHKLYIRRDVCIYKDFIQQKITWSAPNINEKLFELTQKINYLSTILLSNNEKKKDIKIECDMVFPVEIIKEYTLGSHKTGDGSLS